MIDARTFLKLPYSFNDICLVYPPSVNDVIGNDNFGAYYGFFEHSKEDIQDLILEKNKDFDVAKAPTPFEYILKNAEYSKEYADLLRRGFYFFIHEPVTFLFEQKMIVVGNLEKEMKAAKTANKLRIINEENFFDFQNIVRATMGEKPHEKPNPKEHPKITRMKAKARYRDRVKKKSKKNGVPLINSLIAICCMGIGLTPLNIGEISFASVSELMSTYQGKEKYHIDIASLQAGAKKKDVKPKYWISAKND